MKKRINKPKRKINKWLYWTPRVLSILLIIFVSLFSLDVFDSANNYTFWQTILALLMHNIPSFLLIIFLILAWKWEWIGAVGYVFLGLAYIVLTFITKNFQWFMIAWIIQISGPAFVIAILFWLNWKKKLNLL